ncbi:MAG: hypothetical protein HND48_07895 [Chloroflexi bacterium]|nr:hypothetical protein [Chloroflexota bacterium]
MAIKAARITPTIISDGTSLFVRDEQHRDESDAEDSVQQQVEQQVDAGPRRKRLHDRLWIDRELGIHRCSKNEQRTDEG